MKYYLKSTLFLALIFMFSANLVFADFDEEKIKDELPMLLGSGNQGTDFWLTFHPGNTTSGPNNEIKLYIISQVKTTVTLEIPGRNKVVTITTIPGGVVQFPLSPSDAQCYMKEINEDPLPQQVFEGRGLHVYSDDPIIIYGMYRYSLSTDGFLALPSVACGTEYVVQSWEDYTAEGSTSDEYTSYMSVVAIHPDTEVSVTLGGAHANHTPEPDVMRTGDTKTKTMQPGDVWLIGPKGDYNDVTGSYVKSDKPVSVISGNYRTTVTGSSSRDYLIEQMLPMSNWGTKYHVTPIYGRLKASMVRVFAGEKNSTIYRDGDEWAYIKYVGGQENDGWISRRATATEDEDNVAPIVISSDKRISVAQYNTSTSDDGAAGDPFMMNLIPVEQYQKEIMFCTPGIAGNHGFTYNFANICYKATESGGIPDHLEIAEPYNGNISWRPLNSMISDSSKVINDPEITDGRQWHSLTYILPDPAGVYYLRCDEPIGAYGYGAMSADGYGYPLVMGSNSLDVPDVWKPTVEYAMNCFGDVAGRAYEEPRKIDSLRSNFASVELVSDSSYNYIFEFNADDLVPGETSILDWTLKVENELSNAQATLLFTDKAGNETIEVIEYKATKLKINPRIANWSIVNTNDTTSSKDLTLINESEKAITVDSLFLLSQAADRTWEDKGFNLTYVDGLLPAILGQGEELTFTVTFDPTKVEDGFLAGETSFVDSIGVKAEWSKEYQDYCYYQYNSVVKAIVDIPAPTLIAPENNATEIAALTTFEWSEVADAVSYTLEISRSTAFIAGNTITQEVTGNNYTLLSELKKGITYYWHVKTRTASHESDWSEVWHFTTKEAMPAPTLIAPANASTNIPITPIFEWESISEATKYNIEVSRDAGFNTMVVDEELTSNTYSVINELRNDKTYYWHVRAINDNETSDWSEEWSFTTEPASAVNDENVLAGSDIKIIPNPANENITIVADFILTSAKIYDLAGNLVLEANTHNIDISQLPHGAYVIVIETKHKTERATFIKE